MAGVDRDLLASRLRGKMDEEKLSVRKAADLGRCSSVTSSRRAHSRHRSRTSGLDFNTVATASLRPLVGPHSRSAIPSRLFDQVARAERAIEPAGIAQATRKLVHRTFHELPPTPSGLESILSFSRSPVAQKAV